MQLKPVADFCTAFGESTVTMGWEVGDPCDWPPTVMAYTSGTSGCSDHWPITGPFHFPHWRPHRSSGYKFKKSWQWNSSQIVSFQTGSTSIHFDTNGTVTYFTCEYLPHTTDRQEPFGWWLPFKRAFAHLLAKDGVKVEIRVQLSGVSSSAM